MERTIVAANPEVMSGTPCSAGMSAPVKRCSTYLEAEDSIDDFGFPTVKREQALALHMAKLKSLTA